MFKRSVLQSSVGIVVVVMAWVGALGSTASAQTTYAITKLVADTAGTAPHTDANLINPWGMARGASTAWWVADNGTGVSTIYRGDGTILSLVVTVPPPATGTPPSTPTGVVGGGGGIYPVTFTYVTEDGTISKWTTGTAAVLKVDNSGSAVYKGAAAAVRGGQVNLYVANFFTGAVEVYDPTFNPISLPPGAFTDPTLPAGYAPFNIANVGGKLYVCFAEQDASHHDEVAGPGLGWVTVFDVDGTVLSRLQHGQWMNAPWGVVRAPANFGKFSGAVLVGNFGSGKIAAFNATNENFAGFLMNSAGAALTLPGLWGLGFGNGGMAGPTNTLYFTAGTGGEAHGLFGAITAH